jgi:hypothetical protein
MVGRAVIAALFIAVALFLLLVVVQAYTLAMEVMVVLVGAETNTAVEVVAV